MKKIIFLLIIVFSVSLFAEYRSEIVTINNVKLDDSEFLIDTTAEKPLDFEKFPIGKESFDKDLKISVNYSLNAGSDVLNPEFELKYNGNRVDYSEELSSALSFNLSKIFTSVPIKNSETFKVDLVVTYDTSITQDQTKTISFTFHYDTVPPGKAKNLKLVAGDKSINVSWDYEDGVDDKEIDKVVIYYKDSEESEYSEKEATSLSTEYKIKDLVNEHEYSVYVKFYDLAGNESENSEELTAIPVPVDDFYKYYRKSGGKEDGGYCFIATAAYGSYDDGMVKILRNFRDAYLPQAFIDTYYKYSPPVANIIAKSKVLSFITRILLEPFVLYANFFLYAGFAFKFLMLFMFMALLFVKIKAGRIYYV